jgi:hypothetical protein
MITPRAADDFEIIRERLEELRRERAQASRDAKDGPARRDADPGGEPETPDRRLSRVARQRLFR